MSKYFPAGYIGGKEITDNTIVVLNDGDSYKIGKLSDIPTEDALVNTTVYSDKDGVVQIIYCQDVAEDVVYGFVSEVATVKNKDNKEVQKITLVGVDKPYLTTATCDKFTGDKSKLYAFTLSGSEIDAINKVDAATDDCAVSAEANVTDINASKNTINIGNGFELVNADAAITRLFTRLMVPLSRH